METNDIKQGILLALCYMCNMREQKDSLMLGMDWQAIASKW